MCFDVFRDHSELITPAESAWPRPDLLELTAGSDVSIVVKHEISSVLGKSNGQPLVSLNYYLFQSK